MGSEPTGLGLLILHAKFDSDDNNRILAGEALVEACSAGKNPAEDLSTLKSILQSEDFHPRTKELAKKKITDAALLACIRAGSLAPLWDIAGDRTLPRPVLQFAGMKLFEKLSEAGESEGLISLSSGESFHEEPRKAAGFRLLHSYEEEKAYTQLYSLVVKEGLLYEVRKVAGVRLSDLCVKEGNYPLLLRMGSDERVPLNVRIELDIKMEKAAAVAIEDALKRGDSTLLSFISSDERLPEAVRKDARMRQSALARAEWNGSAGAREAFPRSERPSGPPPSIRPKKNTY